MATYKTVLFKFDGSRRTLEKGLTLEEAQEICRDDNSSSRTCADAKRMRNWGKHWFIGYTEE